MTKPKEECQGCKNLVSCLANLENTAVLICFRCSKCFTGNLAKLEREAMNGQEVRFFNCAEDETEIPPDCHAMSMWRRSQAFHGSIICHSCLAELTIQIAHAMMEEAPYAPQP